MASNWQMQKDNEAGTIKTLDHPHIVPRPIGVTLLKKRAAAVLTYPEPVIDVDIALNGRESIESANHIG